MSWATARRAWLEVYEDRVECADWIIPYDEVTQAVIYRARQWLIPVSLLRIDTARATYQFGFNPWADPVKHLGLEVTEQRVKVRTSPVGLVIRIGIVGLIAYSVWRSCSA